MFGRFSRVFNGKFTKKLLCLPAIITTSVLSHKFKYHAATDLTNNQMPQNLQSFMKGAQSLMEEDEILTIQICESNLIRQGRAYGVLVNDIQGNPHEIIIVRCKGKLYALLGICTFDDINEPNLNPSLSNSIVFNDKLLCPHHGCAFDIKSGIAEYGPAYHSLPIFQVDNKDGKVFLTYPKKIPKKIMPLLIQKDPDDLRKVVILGDDHAAVAGAVQGLRSYGFDGSIQIIQSEVQYPYRKDILHKNIPNLSSQIKDLIAKRQEIITKEEQLCTQFVRKLSEIQKQITKAKSKNKSELEKKKNLLILQRSQSQKVNQKQYINIQKQSEKEISNKLEKTLYQQLLYHSQQFYKSLGIEFIFTRQTFRIIGKRYFPYLTFNGGMKIQYDGLIIAMGSKPLIHNLPGITDQYFRKKQFPPNVFAPEINKYQHQRLVKFLNTKKVNTMTVLGLTQNTLQFITEINKQFPNIKINVLDFHKTTPTSFLFGDQIEQFLIKDFVKKGVNFFVNILNIPYTLNTLSKPKQQQIMDQINKERDQKIGLTKTLQQQQQQKYLKTDFDKNIRNSIRIGISNKKEDEIISDCAVLFFNEDVCEVEQLKSGKYIQLQYNHQNRIKTDPHTRSDSKRIFAVGSNTLHQYFFTRSKYHTKNSLYAYQQGLTAAFNVLAMNVPFHYIPFRKYYINDKKLLTAGVIDLHGSHNYTLTIGSIQNWDFITLYASETQILGVAASPSKQRDFQIIRQAMRQEILPPLKQIHSGKWSIPLIQKFIRVRDKAGCYKNLYHTLQQNVNITDVIFVQRKTKGFTNDHPLVEDESSKQIDQRGYVREV